MDKRDLDRAVKIIENSALGNSTLMEKPAMLINKHGTHIITENGLLTHIGEAKIDTGEIDYALRFSTLIAWLASGIFVGMMLAYLIYMFTE